MSTQSVIVSNFQNGEYIIYYNTANAALYNNNNNNNSNNNNEKISFINNWIKLDLRVDIKNGILNRPDKTLSRTDCNDDPSNGRAPQTRT